jgi:hypothetical protein
MAVTTAPAALRLVANCQHTPNRGNFITSEDKLLGTGYDLSQHEAP